MKCDRSWSEATQLPRTAKPDPHWIVRSSIDWAVRRSRRYDRDRARGVAPQIELGANDLDGLAWECRGCFKARRKAASLLPSTVISTQVPRVCRGCKELHGPEDVVYVGPGVDSKA